MWHIVAIGYIFTTAMIAFAQPSLARILIYLVFWTILPTVFVFWVAITRRRNRLMKQQEHQAWLKQQENTHSNSESAQSHHHNHENEKGD